MKIVCRDNKGLYRMGDTITNITYISEGNGNDYFLHAGGLAVCKGSQSELEKIFNDIVAAEKRGDKVYEIK